MAYHILLLLNLLSGLAMCSLNCPTEKSHPLQFHLVRQCQRASADDALTLESTSSLEECASLTRELRGLAFNYAPGGWKRHNNQFDLKIFRNETEKQKHIRSQLTVFQQPGEFFNCHVLACPQNHTFSGMVNDSRFDYYSLYGRPTGKCIFKKIRKYVYIHTFVQLLETTPACQKLGYLWYIPSQLPI